VRGVSLHVAIALSVAVALVAVLLAWWLYIRRVRQQVGRKLRRPAEKLRYPLVLAHGLAGFREIAVAGVRREYFRGVPVRLTELGAQVHLPKLSPFASVPERAKQLAEAVSAIDAKKVNLIAHSLGGLDARYALSRLGLAPRVASLITIGTPHHGTPVADFGTSLGAKLGLKAIAETLGLDVSVFFALTTEEMKRFNAEVPDARGVWYASLVARGGRGMNPLLLAPHAVLERKAGPNDGIVPASSQRWGEVIAEVEADHWAQIGWTDGFDAPGLYLRAVDELKARGL